MNAKMEKSKTYTLSNSIDQFRYIGMMFLMHLISFLNYSVLYSCVMALPSCGEIILSYLMLLESLMVLAKASYTALF